MLTRHSFGLTWMGSRGSRASRLPVSFRNFRSPTPFPQFGPYGKIDLGLARHCRVEGLVLKQTPAGPVGELNPSQRPLCWRFRQDVQ